MLLNEQTVKLKQTKLIRRDYQKYHSYFIEGIGYVPGATTILSGGLPMGDGLKFWLQNKSKEEADKIVKEASDYGTELHRLLELLNQGVVLRTQDHREELMHDCISYVSWYRQWKPEIAFSEIVVAYVDEDYPFAGTIDLVCKIGEENWLIDFKSSNSHQLSHDLQVAAYAEAFTQSYDQQIHRIGVLRLGTKHKQLGRKKYLGKALNGPGYEFTIADNVSFDDFKTVYDNYKLVNGGKIPEPPMEVELPDTIQLVAVEANDDDA